MMVFNTSASTILMKCFFTIIHYFPPWCSIIGNHPKQDLASIGQKFVENFLKMQGKKKEKRSPSKQAKDCPQN
jgi:hypothetical protein